MSVGSWVEAPGTVFVQPLFEQSSVKRHRIGTIRKLNDGRVFAYALAGATLAAGEMTQAAVPDAYGEACAVVTGALGAKTLTVTYGAGTTATANYYQDGFAISVMPSYGIGHIYKIRGHAAATSGGSLVLKLYDTILEALTTSSKISLSKHHQDSVIQSVVTTPTGLCAGVPPIDVTDTYYFWNQVRGMANVLCNGTWVVGEPLVPGAVAGSLMPNAAVTEAYVAYAMQQPTDTYGGMAMLCIPGY